jgi:putative thioredoxin
LIENLDEPKHSDILEAIRTFAQLHELAHHTDRLPGSDVRQLYTSALQSLLVRDFDTALQRFIDVIRQERYYQDDSSRKACIAIFKLLGKEHPITQKYRREFSSALY